ncbi:uracil-DNA glycosylase family protein [Ruficoccus sp. ZRK36]|uniref:uracil-DNA glycosylase family protein n=1 Tax=Ruficoccus sp. ZRK36 TaxID=2866311 RepID=UPI001C731F75|nr:uracil-DNA glycosylase family protein [Ruficoccus sp. ZRK36]QYY34406.1 single-stranded DNA-binding protein [Ruficoccus sp. ZRK36]
MSPAEQLQSAAKRLREELAGLRFGAPVTHIYQPLDYAWEPHAQYLEKYGNATKRVIFMGMNPGPFGMAQTGVPFGEIEAVRDWIGIEAPVGKPPVEHPKRPVDGFACTRSEVSGRRLWGLFAEKFGPAQNFFREHFVANYIPLLFLQADEKGCRNIAPDKLGAADSAALLAACDEHLRTVVEVLQPEWVIGVGKFAEGRAREALGPDGPKIGTVLHPSPASPAANRGWAPQATAQLEALGIWVRDRTGH